MTKGPLDISQKIYISLYRVMGEYPFRLHSHFMIAYFHVSNFGGRVRLVGGGTYVFQIETIKTHHEVSRGLDW